MSCTSGSRSHQSSNWLFQEWFASFPEGAAHRVTNDANNYMGVSVSRDGQSLLVLDSAWPTNIWVGSSGRSASISQVGSPGDGFFGVAWSPDGRIVFGTRDFDIGSCDPDGGNRRVLTVNDHNNRWPAVTKDGRHVFFRSWRGFGTSPLWRMNTDGGDVRALTEPPGGERPAVSPDGKWVFHVGWGGTAVFKVSADGGKSQFLTNLITSVAVSPDGRMLAGPRKHGAPPGVSVLPFDGGSPIYTFDAPAEVTYVDSVRWEAGGQSLLYAGSVNGISNLWRQRLKGGAPTRVTDFGSQYIVDFDVAPDGRLALGRVYHTQNILQLNAVK